VIAVRVDAQVAEQNRSRRQDSQRDSHRLALAIVSLGTGIPITAVAAGTADLAGLVVAWAGIVGVNVSYALRGRRRG
jgi:hypothetical protein